jgi:hypothetical protein
LSHLGLDTVQKHAQAFHYSQLYDANHPIHNEAAVELPNSLQAQHLSVAAKLGKMIFISYFYFLIIFRNCNSKFST